MRRRHRPSLVGTMARTAVISGTATATVNAVGGGRAPAHQPGPAPAAAAPAAAFSGDTLAKLQQLGELRTSGVLTDQEFETAKAKLLG